MILTSYYTSERLQYYLFKNKNHIFSLFVFLLLINPSGVHGLSVMWIMCQMDQ